MELDFGPFSQEVLQRRQPLVSHSADADPTGGLVDCYLVSGSWEGPNRSAWGCSGVINEDRETSG